MKVLKRNARAIVFAIVIGLIILIAPSLTDEANAHEVRFPRRPMSIYTGPVAVQTHGYMHGPFGAMYFQKSHTRSIAGNASVGVGALAGFLCGKIPNKPAPLVVVQGTCAVSVAVNFGRIRDVAGAARDRGQCLRVVFYSSLYVGLKRVGCMAR